MSRFRIFATVVMATALISSLPAAAIVKTAKYSGTISAGLDETGVFATPGTDLAGYSWVASFTYNRAKGAIQYTDGVSVDLSQGGSGVGAPGVTPIIVAEITINGVTRAATGTTNALVRTDTSPFVWHFAQDDVDDGIIYQSNQINVQNSPVGAPASLNQNFGPVFATNGNGYMQWVRYDYETSAYVDNAYAFFGTDALYSVSGVVPEPASWALMIAGFGMVGIAFRQRAHLGVARESGPNDVVG